MNEDINPGFRWLVLVTMFIAVGNAIKTPTFSGISVHVGDFSIQFCPGIGSPARIILSLRAASLRTRRPL
jgi:hypothetical protein